MRKAAIFTSGASESTERLITLFNEGNRIRIEAVVTDGDPAALEQRFSPYGVEVIGVAPESGADEIVEIGNLLAAKGIELYAFDEYEGVMSGWIRNRYPERLVTLTSSENAPREVVAAFAEIDKAPERKQEESAAKVEKTVDEEWAETLHIDFDSRKAAEAAERVAQMTTPPPVPGSQPVPPVPNFGNNPQYFQQVRGGAPAPQNYGNRPVNEEPMPSTYLVWAVIMTVLCCFIPGIVAIIFSTKVSSRYYAGDVEGAKRASRNAEIWIIVSFVLGVLSATLYMPIMMIS